MSISNFLYEFDVRSIKLWWLNFNLWQRFKGHDLPQVITWLCLNWLVSRRVLSSINSLANAYPNQWAVLFIFRYMFQVPCFRKIIWTIFVTPLIRVTRHSARRIGLWGDAQHPQDNEATTPHVQGWLSTWGGSLNTPDERCTCHVRRPGSVGFIFLALPVLAPWWLFLVFFAKFGSYGPKLP